MYEGERITAHGPRTGFKDGNGVYDEKELLGKRVRELMDEGYDFGEAVKQAMKEGYAEGGRIGLSDGQLVRNTVDGSRPGYQGKVDAGFYQKIINNYKNSVAKDFASGDMSKTGSWRNYLQKKYPKNWKKLQDKIKNELNPPTRYQFSFKNKLMKNLIEEANQGERFVQMTEIIDKVTVPAERVDRPGQIRAKSLFEVGEWVDPNLPKLQTQEQKVLKVFNNIINNNEVLQLKDPNFKFIRSITTGETHGANLLRKIIAERTGTASYKTIADALEKHPKMKLKKFRKIFDYMSRSHVNDFEGHRFKDAFDYATDRRSGAAYFTNVNKNIMYKNPDVNIMNYALRHWDGNNFNDQPSRIQFFDKKTGKPIKWKSGLRLSPRNVYFTMDGNPMKWNTQTLKTHGKASGLFDEVVDITNSYYKTYNKSVPDGKGGTIKFGDLVGKNNMAIGHNAIGGVKEEPFKNFQLQSKKMNLGIYHATKHIKNKDLQKRVIGNIYGSLNNLKGDKYIDEFITNFPTTGYKEAGKQIIEGSPEWMKWSSRKQAELFKVAGVSSKDFNALNEMPRKEKISALKKMGYRCLKAGGGGETVECYMDDVKKTRADMKSSSVEVRAKALTKQRNAVKLASKIPEIAKILKTGFQVGKTGLTTFLNITGVGQPIAYAIEGLVEGGFYDNARRKGYSHEQAMAETFTPGLVAGRPHDVPWYGGSEKLREKELYEIKGRNEFIDVDNRPPMQDPEFEKVIGTHGKVKQYIDALKEQDRIYDAIAKKEGARDDVTLTEASADVQDLARSGAYRRVDQTLAPESMASQAYNTAVEKRDALDQKRRTEYLEKYDPKALEIEQKSFDIYVRDKEGNILYEKMTSPYKKRYKEMEEYKGDREGIFGGMTRKEYEKFQEEMPELKNIPYEDQPKFLQYLSTLKAKPEGFDKTYKELFPTPASRYGWDLMGEIARAGGVANMAGGGMVGIRKPHAIPPERQGLRSIMINVNDD